MDFQNFVPDSECVDYSLWSEYSSACHSSELPSSPSDLPSSPNSTTSMSSLLLGDDSGMCAISTLVGANLTSSGDSRNSAFCTSSSDVTSSESNDSVSNVFCNWLDSTQMDQYQNATFPNNVLNTYQISGQGRDEMCSANNLPSCFDFANTIATGCGSPCTKPKRKRVQSKTQRRAANVRERRRMVYLNDAFDNLRKILPAFSYEKNLSRIETLKLAIKYIAFMKDVTTTNEQNDF